MSKNELSGSGLGERQFLQTQRYLDALQYYECC